MFSDISDGTLLPIRAIQRPYKSFCNGPKPCFHQLGPTGPSWSRSRHVRLCVGRCVCLCVGGCVCLCVCAIKSQGSKGGPRAKQSPIVLEASHWPSDHMIRSRPLIGQPPLPPCRRRRRQGAFRQKKNN